jgi:ribose transport system permease protein
MKVMLQKFVRSYSSLAILVTVLIVTIDIILLPTIINPVNLMSTLALLVPLILISMAATPSILSGGGGIDVSMGPIIAFINVAMFTILPFMGITNPVMVIVTLLLFGAAIGTISGLLVTVGRLQPIVATLGVNLVLTGISVHLMPTPQGEIEPWLSVWARFIGPIPGPLLIVAITLISWGLLTRLPYHKALMAVGGDERSAFSAGINVNLVRTLAYTIGGFLGALAAIQLTAFIRAGDASVGNPYTMISIAAAALGGTSLAGGRGGMVGSLFGAMAIFFIQKLLSAMGVANFWYQVVYGAILVAALMSNSAIRMSSEKRIRVA